MSIAWTCSGPLARSPVFLEVIRLSRPPRHASATPANRSCLSPPPKRRTRTCCRVPEDTCPETIASERGALHSAPCWPIPPTGSRARTPCGVRPPHDTLRSRNDGTRTTPSATGGEAAHPCGVACRSDHFTWKPALADPLTVDSPKRSTDALPGAEPEATMWLPTPIQFLARWARGPPRPARSAAVPWYRSPGGSARLRRARRREASCRDPKTRQANPIAEK